ncbi:MAG: hypothetical protein IPJ77_02150 [Planctomycetes bacterium]|nr:hypothetical protein [Planctomycetota bacterium]
MLLPRATPGRPAACWSALARTALAAPLLVVLGCPGAPAEPTSAPRPTSPPTTQPTSTPRATPETTTAPLPGRGPRAEIEFPPEHGFVRTQILRVRGRAADVQELYLNSEKVTCRADGSFDVKLEVPGGQGEIVVRDGASPDVPLLVRHVTVDLEAPVIELTELPGDALENQRYRRKTNAPRVTLRGHASDARPGAIAAVTLDGTECALAPDGTFSVDVDVPEVGERRCELEVVDRAWNRARIVLTLVR